MKAIDKIVLSIDLGITYCCSTVYQNGKEMVIPILKEYDNDDDDE